MRVSKTFRLAGQAYDERQPGYCYLRWFRSANDSGVAKFHLSGVARLLGPYPKVKHVLAHLIKHISHDFYVLGVTVSGDNLLHVGGTEVILFTNLMSGLIFSDARIGGLCYEETVCALEAERQQREHTIHSLLATLRKRPNGDDSQMFLHDMAAKSLRRLQDTHPDDVANVLIGAKKGAARRSISIDLVLTSEEFSVLQQCFPNLNIYVTNKESHSHALAAALRYCSFMEFYSGLPERDTGLFGEQHLVIEFGANVLTHAKNPKRGVHIDSPIIDLRDSQREMQSNIRARALISEGKMEPDVWRAFTGGGKYGRSTSRRCYKKGEECKRTATYGLMLHSHYDITVPGLQLILAQRKIKKLVVYTHFQTSMLFDTHGIDTLLKMTWTRSGGKITFTFAGDDCLGYSHDYDTYVYLLKRNHIRAQDGTIYVVEKTRAYRGTVRIELTRCEMSPTSDTSTLTSSMWVNSDCEEVHLTSWRPLSIVYGDSMVGPASIRFERVRVTCSRRLFDMILRHCLRSGDKTFTFNEVYSAASSFATRLTINGVNIQTDKYISPLDLLQVVLAAYSIAYRERHDVGRTLQAFTQNEKALRARDRVTARDFLKYLFAFGVFRDLCSSVGGYWNQLLRRMGEGVSSVSQLEFAIFAAVREVTVQELITADEGEMPRIGDDYDDILHDLRVTSVDTSADPETHQAVARLVAVYTEAGASAPKDKTLETRLAPPAKVVPPVSSFVQPRGRAQCDSTVGASLLRSKRKSVVKSYRSMRGAKEGDNLSEASANTCRRLKHGIYSCMHRTVVPMPGDGACAYHTMLYTLGMTAVAQDKAVTQARVDAFRNILYALAGPNAAKHSNLRCPTGDRNGWGTDEDFALLCRTINARYCVHLANDGQEPVATLGYTELHALTGDDILHVLWTIYGGTGVHVDAIDDRLPQDRRLHRLQLFLGAAAGLIQRDTGNQDKFDPRGRLPEVLEKISPDFRAAFRSRAGVKLAEMIVADDALRTSLTTEGVSIVDLDAAPGAFVALVNRVNPSAAVTALVKPCSNNSEINRDLTAYTVEADITDVDACIPLLPRAHVVLADVGAESPCTSPDLFISGVAVATAILEAGGTLLIKSSNLLRDDYAVCADRFTSIRVIKPPSSRHIDTEVYYIMTGYSEGRCGDDVLTVLRQEMQTVRWNYIDALSHALVESSAEVDVRRPSSELETELARLYKRTIPDSTVSGGAVVSRAAAILSTARPSRILTRNIKRHTTIAELPEPSVVVVPERSFSPVPILAHCAETLQQSDEALACMTYRNSKQQIKGFDSSINTTAAFALIPTLATPNFLNSTFEDPIGSAEMYAPVEFVSPASKLAQTNVNGEILPSVAKKRRTSKYSCVRTISFLPSVTGPADVTGVPKTGIPTVVEKEGRGTIMKLLDVAMGFAWSVGTDNIAELRPISDNSVRMRDVGVGGETPCTVGPVCERKIDLKRYTRKLRDFSCQVSSNMPPGEKRRATLLLQRPITKGRSMFPDRVSEHSDSSEDMMSPLGLLKLASIAGPGLSHRGIALFADSSVETLLVCFVHRRDAGSKRIDISPGLAKLVNSDDALTSMDVSKYREGLKVVVEMPTEPLRARLVSVRRADILRSVLMVDVSATGFVVVGELLRQLANAVERFGLPTVTVSVDSMRVSMIRPTILDYATLTDSARVLHVCLYSDRMEKLDFVRPPAEGTIRHQLPIGAPTDGESVDSFARVTSPSPGRRHPDSLVVQAPAEFSGIAPVAFLSFTETGHVVTISWCTQNYCSDDCVFVHNINYRVDVARAQVTRNARDVYEIVLPRVVPSSGALTGLNLVVQSGQVLKEGRSASERIQEREEKDQAMLSAEKSLSVLKEKRNHESINSAVTQVVKRVASSVFLTSTPPALSRSESFVPALIKAASTRSTKLLATEMKEVRTFPKLTKSDMGIIAPPIFYKEKGRNNQLKNALAEYVALTRASLRIYAKTARDLLLAYKAGEVATLAGNLIGEEATIYDCATGKVLAGRPMTRHMTAYNLTDGFVPEIVPPGGAKDKFVKTNYAVPPDDTIVVVTRNTKVFLDEKILRRLDALTPEELDEFEIEWVNGVPGCGKTSWIVNHFKPDTDMIVTTTVEAASDVSNRVHQRLHKVDKSRVRTVASVLVNGTRLPEGASVVRVLFDEALMNHFGAVVAVAWVTKAKHLVLIGDVNQIPFIDRLNLFQLSYVRPDKVASISRQLLCTHRNPVDVAYALRSYYPGIYSSCRDIRSLSRTRYSGLAIPATNINTLYLTHTQGDKTTLKTQGVGSGDGSAVMTIHESQGLTFDHVVIVRPTTKPLPIFGSQPHAVVAISRHRKTCVYYSDVVDDAIGRMVSDACKATDAELRDYNCKNAIASDDRATVLRVNERTVESEQPLQHHLELSTHEYEHKPFESVPTVTFTSSGANRKGNIHDALQESRLTPMLSSLASVSTQSRRIVCAQSLDDTFESIDDNSEPADDDSDCETSPLHRATSDKHSRTPIDDTTLKELVMGYTRLALAKAGGVLPLASLMDSLGNAFSLVEGDRDRLERCLQSISDVAVSYDPVVGNTVTLRLTGGYVAETEVFGVRRRLEEDLIAAALLRGLPALAHRLCDYYVAWRSTESMPQTSRLPTVDYDISFLQSIYDAAFPDHAEVLYEHDQICVDNSDLSLGVDRLTIEPGKSYLRPKSYATMRPVLRTMMPNRRLNSQKEAVLGILKRNLNAPRLADASNTRRFIGECMAINFMRSVVDPDKAWLLDDYKDDPIDLNPALVAKWLDTQKPQVAVQAQSEVGLEMRKYNMFSYMVKADLKPPLEEAAQHEYASVQTIAYNTKDVNAVFCTIFSEVRDRLLRVLLPKFQILTGMSPENFVEHLNAKFDAENLRRCFAVENDMRKFDKSQDMAVLLFECTIMRSLGVAEHLVDLWFNSHAESRLVDKNNGIAADINFQRRSGDASTFLGNTLFCMAVVLATYDADDIVLGLFAGDDSLLYMRSRFSASVDNSGKLAALFNLESKLLTGYTHAYFCSKFLLLGEHRLHLVPDPIKTLCKLGRRDLRDPEHVEEYRRSIADNFSLLGNAEWYELLSDAVVERYKLKGLELVKLFSVLYSVLNSPTVFASLYALPDTGDLLRDPSRETFTKKKQQPANHLEQYTVGLIE